MLGVESVCCKNIIAELRLTFFCSSFGRNAALCVFHWRTSRIFAWHWPLLHRSSSFAAECTDSLSGSRVMFSPTLYANNAAVELEDIPPRTMQAFAYLTARLNGSAVQLSQVRTVARSPPKRGPTSAENHFSLQSAWVSQIWWRRLGCVRPYRRSNSRTRQGRGKGRGRSVTETSEATQSHARQAIGCADCNWLPCTPHRGFGETFGATPLVASMCQGIQCNIGRN